MSTILKDPKR